MLKEPPPPKKKPYNFTFYYYYYLKTSMLQLTTRLQDLLSWFFMIFSVHVLILFPMLFY